MTDAIFLTREGYLKLFNELENLKMERVRLGRVIEEARLLGDISENAEFNAAKEAQAHLAARMAELESKLAKVRIIEDENIPDDQIFIGAIVTLRDLDMDEEFTYMMVSPEEANYEENKISIFAPIGKALLGHRVGEELKIKVPAGTLKYKVLKIKRPK
jgi:transcription elongation factor GreA